MIRSHDLFSLDVLYLHDELPLSLHDLQHLHVVGVALNFIAVAQTFRRYGTAESSP